MSKETGSKIYLYGICAVAVIGGLLFGYDTAVISGAEQALQKYFELSLDYYSKTGFLHGFVVSSALVGCVVGGLVSGISAQHLGRKYSLIIASILFFLSALGSFMPEFLFRSNFSFYQPGEANTGVLVAFIIYRIIGGVGVGMASAICPMYIAEVAPAKIRGVLVSYNQFAIIFGQLVVYAINTFIRKGLADTPELIEEAMIKVGWRRMFVSEAVPAALFGILLLFVPKTPRFLVMKGNDEKALNVLTRINGEKNAEGILQEIKDTLQEKTESLFSYGVLVIIVGVLLSFFQQAVGINVVLYYAPRIFENMGATGDVAMIQTVVMGIVNIVFTVVAISTVERWGRRPLLMIGSFGMTIGMAALSVLTFFNIMNITTLIFIIIYTASFMMSWGPVCWVLTSEIFPNTIRSNAVAIAVAVQWTSNLVVSSTFPFLTSISDAGTYLIYAIFSILSALFVYKLIPETKGKTLEEMSELWLSKSKKSSNLPL
ncbi:MFS transporter, SP family [Piromyces finnis]|uniref:MFS transporter, SP family n=1 Tax=Piromyces finnis TaxID=1754191 RepID=A0A1Y1UXU6_9FUNG|nr:MFS transporter, SP family [Piromyces finnis]|eukprot:ORX43135.1 MFS transporter, SP family [Piromyces finnis]